MLLLLVSSLVAFAFFAGLIDAAVGGGGLIQIPALFGMLPGIGPATLLGTNKSASVVGTIFAARRYVRRVEIAWRLVLPAAAAAFALSFAGSALVSLVPRGVMQVALLILLVPMAAYTLIRKEFGLHHRPPEMTGRQRVKAMLLGGAIGFYDGMFGPGTGSFLIFLFVRIFGFDFLVASAHAKIVNIATNLASLVFFIPSGHVLYAYALPMALAQIAGAWCGTWIVLRQGTGFVRILFLLLIAVLIGKTAWDVLML